MKKNEKNKERKMNHYSLFTIHYSLFTIFGHSPSLTLGVGLRPILLVSLQGSERPGRRAANVTLYC